MQTGLGVVGKVLLALDKQDCWVENTIEYMFTVTV